MAKIAPGQSESDTNVLEKLIDGYAEFTKIRLLVNAIIEISNSKAVIETIKDALLQFDLEEEMVQEIMEHTISGVRLNSCNTTRLLIEKIGNVNNQVMESLIEAVAVNKK